VIVPLFRRFARRTITNPPGVVRVVAMLIVILAYGTTGFVYFESKAKPELGWLDGLWWAIVTVTTVGYGDYFPTTTGGRFLVAAPLMFFGIGLLGYVVSLATTALVEARSKELRGMLPVTFKKHVVIFNFPGIAKIERVIDELRHDEEFGTEHEIVLVDEDLVELPAELASRHIHFVRGVPSRDDTLQRANIDQATHAIVLAKRASDPQSDAQNLIITLAIEARTRSVRTTVECVEVSAQELLRKAGCDSIVCLARFDAHFIGNEVLQPGMQAVIDGLMSTSKKQQLCLSAAPKSASTYADLVAACKAQDHTPLGILRGVETMLNLANDVKLASGDRVISIGTQRLR
jgi:voltage-gated potassium channel